MSHSASDFARAALLRIANLGLPPTPENYAKYYSEVSGEHHVTPPPLSVSDGGNTCSALLKLLQNMLQQVSDRTEVIAYDIHSHNDEIKHSINQLSQAQEKETILKLLHAVVDTANTIYGTVNDAHDDLVATKLTLDHIQNSLEQNAQWLQQDPLTGAQNRRGMDMTLSREIARARRTKSRLSAAMIDVDHFKNVNDTFGHEAGDHLLLHLSTIAKSVLRESDGFVRYGGEEFLLIFPDTDINGATFVLDRLRQVIHKSPLIYEGGKIEVTFSGGIAQLKSDENGHALVLRADKALMEAKNSGRNCIKISA